MTDSADYTTPREWERVRPSTPILQDWKNYVSLLEARIASAEMPREDTDWWKDARAMDAILQLAYHGFPVEVRIGGGHDTVHWATYGGKSVSGSWAAVRDALVIDGQSARDGKPLADDRGSNGTS